MFSPLEQFDVKPVIMINFKSFEISLFDIYIPMIISIILFFYIYKLRNNFKLIPSSTQIFFEKLTKFIYTVVKNQIGANGYNYVPLILTIFIFVLMANLLSLIPFGVSLTSHLIIILWISLTLGLSILVLGFWLKGMEFLKIFIPQCPIALLPLIIIIEIFSYIIRCFSLAIRLSANMLAGHTLVAIIALFILNVVIINFMFGTLGFISLLAVLFLEIGVSFLQAYVITILTCIYLNDVLGTGSH